MERFADIFRSKGFIELKVNVPNILVYVKRDIEKDYAIILFDILTGGEWNKEQCAHVEKQLLDKLSAENPNKVQLITFLCTNNVDAVRNIYRQNNHTAVIDFKNNRLLIFEEMQQDDLNIYAQIEKALQFRETQSVQYADEVDEAYCETRSLKDRKVQVVNGLRQVGYANSIIIALNILIFAFSIFTNMYDMTVENGSLYWPAVNEYHEYYRIITCMFLHGGISHLLNNMVILAGIGGILEKHLGTVRYCILYFLSGVVAGITSLVSNMNNAYVSSIGASGAIFGVIGAVLWIVLINKGRVENLSRRRMILFVVFSLYGGFVSQGVDNAAHIGGLIGGFILAVLLYRKPKRRGVVS